MTVVLVEHRALVTSTFISLLFVFVLLSSAKSDVGAEIVFFVFIEGSESDYMLLAFRNCQGLSFLHDKYIMDLSHQSIRVKF